MASLHYPIVFSENLVDAKLLRSRRQQLPLSGNHVYRQSIPRTFPLLPRFRRATLQLLRLTAQSISPASVIQKEKLSARRRSVVPRESLTRNRFELLPTPTTCKTGEAPAARVKQHATGKGLPRKHGTLQKMNCTKISVRPSRPERPAPL